jgi:hypothetical protein
MRWVISLMVAANLCACQGKVTKGTDNGVQLSISLSALPENGDAPLNGIDLIATFISGNPSGELTCEYDCDAGDGVSFVAGGRGPSPLSVVDACSYSSEGSYTATVRCQQGLATDEKTVTITVSGRTLYDGPCEDGRGSGTSIVYTNTWGTTIEGKTSASVGFEFDCDSGPCLCGKFADEHSFWVAPPPGTSGVVNIDGFSPARCPECLEASGSGSTLRDGWLANPTGDMHQYRGMDGRLGSVDQPSPLVPTPGNPYVIDTTAPGFVARMILKADSDLDGGSNCGHPTTGMCLEYFNAIAVLASAPADNGATVLRPAIYGGGDTQKELLTVSTLDMSVLPAMNIELRPSTGKHVGLGWDKALEALLEPKTEWFFDWAGTETGTAARNYSRSNFVLTTGYAPNKEKAINEALLWLTFDPVQQGGSDATKRLLAIRAAQIGMDICGVILFGGSVDETPGEFGSWPANGGHSMGRYAPPIVASVMLHHTACLAALKKSADNHLKSFCVGGSDNGKRCGDHWGLSSCGGGGVCTLSTNPADICDEHLAMFAETSQQQKGNMHGANGANIALYGVWSNWVRPVYPGGSNPTTADDEAWIDGGSAADNGCPGNYQPLSWTTLSVALPVLKAIPATWPYVNPTYFEYMDRMHRVGTHCSPDNRIDKHGSDQSGNADQVTQICGSGIDVNRPCLSDDDCAGTLCNGKGPLYTIPSVNYRDPANTSRQSLYQYETNKDCYNDCSCPGMSGLCD